MRCSGAAGVQDVRRAQICMQRMYKTAAGATRRHIMEFCQVLVSATNKKEADRISDTLVRKKLAAGSLITKGSSRYWWKGEIVEKEYYNIQCFSVLGNKSRIISEVKKIHSDKCPIIAFSRISGNSEFLKWVKESVV